VELPTAFGQSRRARRKGYPALETPHVARAKKKARKERRTIVFVDESGLSERPSVTRTWAPRGQTPQLTFHFNWGKLAIITGVTWWRFYFRIYRGSIRTPQVLDFLRQLLRQIRGRLLVIWDGLAAHRSWKVRSFIEATRGRLIVARLPAYAPELNPAEYVWCHLKRHALANFCPRDWTQLTIQARRRLQSAQRRPSLIRAFWSQAELSLL
jgi:transposase